MNYSYDRTAARKPPKLTPDEIKAMDALGRKLSGLNLGSFRMEDVKDIKPNVLRSLYKKDMIHVEYKIRFMNNGYYFVESM